MKKFIIISFILSFNATENIEKSIKTSDSNGDFIKVNSADPFPDKLVLVLAQYIKLVEIRENTKKNMSDEEKEIQENVNKKAYKKALAQMEQVKKILDQKSNQKPNIKRKRTTTLKESKTHKKAKLN